MSSVRIGLAPLEHRSLCDSVGTVRVAAGEATGSVRSDNETEPRDYLTGLVIPVVLAEHPHDVLAALEDHSLDVQAG